MSYCVRAVPIESDIPYENSYIIFFIRIITYIIKQTIILYPRNQEFHTGQVLRI